MTHKDFKNEQDGNTREIFVMTEQFCILTMVIAIWTYTQKKHCIESQAPPTPNWQDADRVCGLYQSQFPDSNIVQELHNALYYWQRLGDESQIKDLSVLFLQLPVSL